MNGVPVAAPLDVSALTTSGHAAIGTRQYGDYTQFDNFQLYSSYVQCGATALAAGAPVSVVHCNAEVGPVAGSRWDFTPIAGPAGVIGAFSLRSNAALCLAATPNATGSSQWLALAPCAKGDPQQTWRVDTDGISPDNERRASISIAASGNGRACIDIVAGLADIGLQMDAWPCNGAGNQNFYYDHDAGEIASEASSTCVGVC